MTLLIRSNRHGNGTAMTSKDVLSCLPEDVFFQIVLFIGISAVLNLKQVSTLCSISCESRVIFGAIFDQTCRGLNAIIDSDYLWHQLISRSELTLGIPSFVDPNKLSGKTLQLLAVRALRLEANWARKAPRIRGVNAVLHGTYEGSFDDMKLLPGATTLVTVRRNRHRERPTVTISAFSLSNVRDAYKAASFEIAGYLTQLDVSLVDDGQTLIYAASIKNEGKEYAI